MSLLELLVPSVCPACDRPRGADEVLLCPACALHLRSLSELGGVATAVAYERTGLILVRRFKFEDRRDALRVLLELLAVRVQSLPADGIVAVPRHRRRVREQGGDPVWALARALARRTGLELLRGALSRTRPTPPQSGLSPLERRQNVGGSFRARGDLRRRRILLLDDVTTTGSTLLEAARELRRGARPRQLIPVALAGTPLPGAERLETEHGSAL